VWNFVLEPRRVRGVTSVMVPEPATAPASAVAVAPPTPAQLRMPAAAVGPGAVVELLRSLERMEADLAEMRSEVERMRRHLVSAPSLPVQPRPPR
jgi:hypothetical protein